jgi:hypothetical protein
MRPMSNLISSSIALDRSAVARERTTDVQIRIVSFKLVMLLFASYDEFHTIA